jgi:hypothetical protein
MSAFDALAVDNTASVLVPILHPKTRQPIRDAEGKEAHIDLLPLTSPEVQKVQKAAINKRLKARGRATMTADELEAERAETFVAATKGWYLVNPNDGSKLDVPFTPENARTLYTDLRFAWIRDQVSEALDDPATFS